MCIPKKLINQGIASIIGQIDIGIAISKLWSDDGKVYYQPNYGDFYDLK